MATIIKRSASVAGLQALISADEALGYSCYLNSFAFFLDPNEGPIYTVVMDNNLPLSSTVLSEVYTTSAVDAFFAAVTPSCASVITYVHPIYGESFLCVRIVSAAIISNRTIGTALALVSNTPVSALSLTVPRGRWMMSGCLTFDGAAATVTSLLNSFSTTNNVIQTEFSGQPCMNALVNTFPAAVSGPIASLVLPPLIYDGGGSFFCLVARAVFSAGNVSVYGQLQATPINVAGTR